MKPENVKSLLIARPDNLGDFILFSGCLKHFREHYPKARITLCVKEYVKNYVEFCPHADEIVSWEDLKGALDKPILTKIVPHVRGVSRVENTLKSIRNSLKSGYDLVLMTPRSPTAAHHAFMKQINAKEKIGISGNYSNQTEAEDCGAEKNYTRRMPSGKRNEYEHELIVHRDFLDFLGIEAGPRDIRPEYWTTEEDVRFADETTRMTNEGILIAIAPGVSTFMQKYYPSSNYGRIIEELEDIDFNILLLGGEKERGQCETVLNTVETYRNVKSAANLAGKTSFRQMIEILKNVDSLLSADTAALHAGVMLHRPTVGIMGGGHYGRFYPWGDPEINRVAFKRTDCYHCNWKCIHPEVKCIREIEPAIIAGEVRAALKNSGVIK